MKQRNKVLSDLAERTPRRYTIERHIQCKNDKKKALRIQPNLAQHKPKFKIPKVYDIKQHIYRTCMLRQCANNKDDYNEDDNNDTC